MLSHIGEQQLKRAAVMIMRYDPSRDKLGPFNAGTSEGAMHVLGRALEKFYPEAYGRLADDATM